MPRTTPALVGAALVRVVAQVIRLLRAIGVAVLEHIDAAVTEWANSTAGPTWEEDE